VCRELDYHSYNSPSGTSVVCAPLFFESSLIHSQKPSLPTIHYHPKPPFYISNPIPRPILSSSRPSLRKPTTMTRVTTESHPSSKTPTAYVPSHERLDLTMPKSVLQKPHTFTCAHLNYLECRGESIFADEKASNLFMNALRLHWKVSGNVLRSALDQGSNLYELLVLEMDGVYIITGLFTDNAVHELLGRDAPDCMVILATIVHDIYTAQWRSWSEEQNSKHRKQSQYALIISHAQATSNQLSNNVLAFKGQTTPELRKWAEMTVAHHLKPIVTPGHLPPASADKKANWFFKSRSIPVVDRIDSNSNKATEQGHLNQHHQVSSHSASYPPKRRFGTNWYTSPSKRVKVNTEYIGRFRASDIYRPSGYKGPAAFVHNHSGSRRPLYRYLPVRSHHDFLSTSPPIKSSNRHERQVPSTSSDEQLRKNKLDEVQAKVTQQKSDAISCIDSTGAGSNFDNPHEPQTPVVKGPSYTEYLRKKENETVSPLTAYKVRTTGHIRTQSYIGSEDGEILE
jgi:hypothetical protein